MMEAIHRCYEPKVLWIYLPQYPTNHCTLESESDCNYTFKHIGREMMQIAAATSSLAPKPYESRKNHRAIGLAVNKTLTNNLLRQLK